MTGVSWRPPPAPAGWARPVARGRPGAGGGGGAGRQIHELVVVSAPPPRRDVTHAVRHSVPVDGVLIFAKRSVRSGLWTLFKGCYVRVGSFLCLQAADINFDVKICEPAK